MEKWNEVAPTPTGKLGTDVDVGIYADGHVPMTAGIVKAMTSLQSPGTASGAGLMKTLFEQQTRSQNSF